MKMKIKDYYAATSEQLEQEIDIAFLNHYGNIEDETKINRMTDLEIMNNSVLILLEILKAQNVDIMQEVGDKFAGSDDEHDISTLMIHDIIADRVDYVDGYMNDDGHAAWLESGDGEDIIVVDKNDPQYIAWLESGDESNEESPS